MHSPDALLSLAAATTTGVLGVAGLTDCLRRAQNQLRELPMCPTAVSLAVAMAVYSVHAHTLLSTAVALVLVTLPTLELAENSTRPLAKSRPTLPFNGVLLCSALHISASSSLPVTVSREPS
jgi:hypothetical protein